MGQQQRSKGITPAQCATHLMEAMPLVMRFMRSEMRHQSASVLSVPQFRSLNFLDRHPGSSLSDLAEHLGVTRATASALIQRLVERQFVTRTDDPQERRQVVLKLTTSGATHIKQSRENTRDKVAERLIPLSEAQLATMTEGLMLLSEVFANEPSEAVNET